MMAAVALDLGAMLDDEVSAESLYHLDRMVAYGTLMLVPTQEGVLGFLNDHCSSAIPTLTPRENQVTFVIGRGRDINFSLLI